MPGLRLAKVPPRAPERARETETEGGRDPDRDAGSGSGTQTGAPSPVPSEGGRRSGSRQPDTAASAEVRRLGRPGRAGLSRGLAGQCWAVASRAGCRARAAFMDRALTEHAVGRAAVSPGHGVKRSIACKGWRWPRLVPV